MSYVRDHHAVWWVEDDPDNRQSTTACCPRETIPDSCSCPDDCDCGCLDCECADRAADDERMNWLPQEDE